VALLTGEGTRAYNAGEVWHLLSERMQMPVSLLDVDNVAWADLNRYNRLVLAGGSYNALPAEKIKNWVRQGGVLIALTDAVDWVVAQGLVSLKSRPFNLDSLLRPYPYGQLERARGAQVIGGAILEARLDTTHPLAFGLGATLPVFRTEEPSTIPPRRRAPTWPSIPSSRCAAGISRRPAGSWRRVPPPSWPSATDAAASS